MLYGRRREADSIQEGLTRYPEKCVSCQHWSVVFATRGPSRRNFEADQYRTDLKCSSLLIGQPWNLQHVQASATTA